MKTRIYAAPAVKGLTNYKPSGPGESLVFLVTSSLHMVSLLAYTTPGRLAQPIFYLILEKTKQM